MYLRDLTARHRSLADVERADLRRERRSAIVTDLLLTDSALCLLLEREFEDSFHSNLVVRKWLFRL